MDKKDDFEEISSMVEKSTQTLVEEQKIVEKLKKKLSATKSSQLRKGKRLLQHFLVLTFRQDCFIF